MTFQNQNTATALRTEDEIHALVDELVEFAESPQSRNFYFKAINALGVGLVREGLGEVRMRCNDGGIKDRAAYLTTLLIVWMKDRGLYQSPGSALVSEPSRAFVQNTSLDDFKPLPYRNDDLPINYQGESREMEMPYSPDLFQWASHLGNEFFTLTNETADADRCVVSIDIDGLPYKVPVLRGKLYREDKEERGIPTTEHMRVLHAIEAIWTRLRGPHEIDQKGFALCKALIPVLDVARYLGLSPGGREYRRIIEKAVDLSTTGYVFLTKDLPGYTRNGKTLEDVPFKFFAEVKPMNVRDNRTGKRTSYLRVIFSEQYSRWLLSGRVVSRPLELLKKRGDIAFKLAVYLFPILKKRDEHSIELNELIDRIGLKRTGWSAKKGYKSQRKREFEKAVKELNGLPSGDGRSFAIQITQGLNAADYMLVSRLKNP